MNHPTSTSISTPTTHTTLLTATLALSFSFILGYYTSTLTKQTKLPSSSSSLIKSRSQPPIRTLINEVLNFWFHFDKSTPLSSLHSSLWMTTSPAQRFQADHDIHLKFGYLTSKLSTDSTYLQSWLNNQEGSSEQDRLYAGMSAIIVLDQFTRHIHRYTSSNCISSILPDIEVTDKLALSIAQSLTTTTHQQEESTSVSPPLIDCNFTPLQFKVFILMPYRHSRSLPSLQFVMECITRYDDNLDKCDKQLLVRFRKATSRRVDGLLSLCVASGKAEESESSGKGDDVILERYEIDSTRMADTVVNQACFKSIKLFLEQERKERNMNNLEVVWPVAVSLSGGVDSMVICRVLVFLRDMKMFNISLSAIHIDYNNRSESGLEAEYLKRWCDKYDISLKIRKIDGLKRGEGSRDDYEKMSRTIRFDAYKESFSTTSCTAVMVGHHKGDVQENVISNAMKGKGPLDLSGMSKVGKINGVIVHRPLLMLGKEDVYDFAHRFGVSYFKDTTPRWSTRGKLRNVLVPLLSELYGEGFLNNLSSLAKGSDDCKELVDNAVFKPFLKDVTVTKCGFYFDTKAWVDQSLFFWSTVLQSLLHSNGLAMLTQKSLSLFLSNIREMKEMKGKREGRWLQLRPDYGTFLGSDGVVYVLNNKTFAWGKEQVKIKEEEFILNVRVSVGEVLDYRGWRIKVTALDDDDDDGDDEEEIEEDDLTLLNTKPFPSGQAQMDKVLSGKFSYYTTIRLTNTLNKLGFWPLLGTGTLSNSKSVKNSAAATMITKSDNCDRIKIKAFVGLHEKVCNSLPLVRDLGDRDLGEDGGRRVVRVDFEWIGVK